jgi:hypothetical protein
MASYVPALRWRDARAQGILQEICGMDSTSVSIVASLIENDMPKVADAVVEKGAEYVQNKLGVDLQANLTPEQIVRLSQEAVKHEEFMAELDEKSRERASNMQIRSIDSHDPMVRRFIYWFAWFWSIVSVTYFFAVTFAPNMNKDNQHFADTILGFLLGTTVASIIQFFYGSSKSSQDKTQIMREQAQS